jgi:hypothetical protein
MPILSCPAVPHPTYPLIEFVRMGDLCPGCEQDFNNPDDWLITCDGVDVGDIYQSYDDALEAVDAVLFSKGDGSYAQQVIASACAIGAIDVAVSLAHGLGYEQGVSRAKEVFMTYADNAHHRLREDIRSFPEIRKASFTISKIGQSSGEHVAVVQSS